MIYEHIPKGLCDMHLHLAPSLIPRDCDIAEMAAMAKDAGYRAIVAKDHHALTAPLCGQLKKHLFADADIDIFGSFCMNNATGGLNPYTAEAAICWGIKILWLPTCSAARHIDRLGTGGKKGFPGTNVTIHEGPLVLTKPDGTLKDEVIRIIELVAQAPSVTLATGHASAEEVNAVVEKAAELGVKHILVDHPTFCVEASLEQMRHWVELGAVLEHVGAICDASTACYQPPADIAEVIRATGVEHTLLSSDYGQLKLGNPIAGMNAFLGSLKEYGFTDDEIRTMCCDNPGKLLYT